MLDAGAIVYFQSPDTMLGPVFDVQEAASFSTSTAIGNAPPHISGPTVIEALIGETVTFGDTQDCLDYEDGILAVDPVDWGVLGGSPGSEIFIIECTDLDGATTQKALEVIKS